MAGKIFKWIAVCGACAFLAGGYFLSRNASEVEENLPVSRILGDFAIDTNNPCEVVGFSDYYFIAAVEEIKETSYRNEVFIETESGGQESVTVPYTDYAVAIIRNIKGTLPENTLVVLTKVGGISKDGSTIIVYENDMLLETGETYAMTATVQQDGTLLVSGPNSCRQIEEEVKTWDSEIDLLESYFTNEIPYERQRYPCKF